MSEYAKKRVAEAVRQITQARAQLEEELVPDWEVEALALARPLEYFKENCHVFVSKDSDFYCRG